MARGLGLGYEEPSNAVYEQMLARAERIVTKGIEYGVVSTVRMIMDRRRTLPYNAAMMAGLVVHLLNKRGHADLAEAVLKRLAHEVPG